MKIFISSDHAGLELKEKILNEYQGKFDLEDLGTYTGESTSYSKYGHLLAQKVVEHTARGIAICGSGIGISIAVNRHESARGALCRSTEDARLSRQHNNANILCLGARVTGLSLSKQMIDIFLSTPFEGGRHQERVEAIELD